MWLLTMREIDLSRRPAPTSITWNFTSIIETMRIEQLLADYGIPYVTEHKNVRDGWIGIHCPFCPGSQNYHLGYDLYEHYFSCWRCGGHSTEHTIATLLAVNWEKAKDIIEKYGGEVERPVEEVKEKQGTLEFKYPVGDLTIQPAHKHYLEKRKYDPDKIITTWKLHGTGPVAKLDGIDYARRILAPIYWGNKVVSFQARDITGKHPAKYMACPPEREIISHKHIIYKYPQNKRRRGICVEGITDVWRLGINAFCVFGVKFTLEQIKAIALLYDEVIIVFDPDKAAQRQARKLFNYLDWKGLKVRIVSIDTDPGAMRQEHADDFVKELMK